MIQSIDHIVMTVESIQPTVDFYTKILGLEQVNFGEGRVALVFGSQKINIHECETDIEPRASNPVPGSLDLCFVSDTPIDLVIDHLRESQVEIIEGPIERTGARGKILSVYFRDPSGNLIELSNYL